MRRNRITTLATVVAATSMLVGSAVSAQSPAASTAAGSSTLKIGLVTDVGTLDDKNFNQYSWEGAQDGADRDRRPAPKSAISRCRRTSPRTSSRSSTRSTTSS